MRPVAQTPTETAARRGEASGDDKGETLGRAVLTGFYGSLLGVTALSARRRAPVGRDELPVLAAATFALSKLIVHEKVESWVREPFVDEQAEPRRPKGRRLRYAVGELLTCTRCTGAWSALALVSLRLHAPATGRTVATVLAASAGNDMLQAAFSWLCAHERTASDRAALTRAAA